MRDQIWTEQIRSLSINPRADSHSGCYALCTPTCVCADFNDFSTHASKLGAAPNGDARTQFSISTHAHIGVNEALMLMVMRLQH